MTLRCVIPSYFAAHYKGAVTEGASPIYDLPSLAALILETGTGANESDLLYAATRTLAPSGTENLDLAGVLTDPFGSVLTFARVKVILVRASSLNVNNVVLGAGTNPWAGPWAGTLPTHAVSPGGLFLAVAPNAAGWPVTAATADILKVLNSGAGTPVTYDIVLAGASA